MLLPGGLLLGLLVALPLAGPWAGRAPLRVVAAPWSPPRPGLPWGADALGRDVLARVLAGGTGPVTTALVAALLATAIGTAGGLWVGWTGGRRARVVTALSDVLVAVPLLLLVLVAAVTVPGPAAVVLGTVVGGAPLTVRVVADATARARTAGHVEAALALRPGERDEHGVRRWPVPGAAGQLRQVGGEVVDDGRAALAHRGERPARRVGHGRVRCDARGADQRGPAVLGELVDQRERQVLRVAGQRPPGRGVHLRPGPGRPQVGGEVAQRLHAAFAEHAVGVLGDHAEHPRDRAVLVQRAVGEGVVGLLEVAAAFEEQQEVLAPGGPPPASTDAIIGPTSSQTSAHTSRAERPSAHGCLSRSVSRR